MANQWLRLYSEFATDPKVQMMSESNQRRLIMLLCLRCNGNVTLHDDEVTFLMRISNDEWKSTKAIFIDKGFINDSNELLNWDKRQFASDSSAARVAKHREKKKQQCNVTVTPQNRTDTEQNRTDLEKNIKKENEELPEQNLVDPDTWNHFLKIRKKVKAVNSPLAIKLLIKELENLVAQGNDPNEVVQKSIVSGWKDLYPVKNKPPPRQSQQPKGMPLRTQEIDHGKYEAVESV